jgi:hypothetical protein
MPSSKRMPGTIERSLPKARRTWGTVYDEKVGERGEPKRRRYSAEPYRAEGRRGPRRASSGGVDYSDHNKVDLYERARTLRIPGRSHMSKKELARAIARARQ